MAGVALANMGWVGVAEIGLSLRWSGAGVCRESREEACRYGGESFRGRRRPTVIPVTSAAEVLIRGRRRACQYGLGRSRGNRFGLKGGVGAGVRWRVSGKSLPAQRCLSQVRAPFHHPSPTRGRWLSLVDSRPDRGRKYFFKSKYISDSIYHLYLRHAIIQKVVV